ncbi:MAG: hypothetical protein ABFS02_08240 [Pseudomonadota bacterium]
MRDVNERKNQEQALRRLQSENLNLREELKRRHDVIGIAGDAGCFPQYRKGCE